MTWAAPQASGRLDARVSLPGSKSATARCLVLACLADGVSLIRGGLVARDSRLMMDALRALGARIDDSDPATWRVEPLEQSAGAVRIDCGLAGTVARFLPPVAALSARPVCFVGDPAMSRRPLAPLLDGLRQLGARVEGTAVPFCLSGPLSGGEARIDAAASSQFVSGLLLSAARMPQGLRLTHVGGPIPSMPHIDMTLAALVARGVQVSAGLDNWQVAPGPISALDQAVEPDLTTAAVFLAAALVSGGKLTIGSWPSASAQPGAATPQILSSFGGSFHESPDGLTVVGDGCLQGVDIDLHQTSELTPVVAALAALAQTPTRIRGVGHIRGHETNRLEALSQEINALGGQCTVTPDGLSIQPRPLRAGLFHCYADHRMAHAGALIGLAVPGVELDDIACTAKTMPQFADSWTALFS